MLITLFYLFEVLLVASVATEFCVDPPVESAVDLAAGFTFWLAFIGQLIVCFLLRRVARRHAVIGWITMFVIFWSLLLFPRL